MTVKNNSYGAYSTYDFSFIYWLIYILSSNPKCLGCFWRKKWMLGLESEVEGFNFESGPQMSQLRRVTVLQFKVVGPTFVIVPLLTTPCSLFGHEFLMMIFQCSFCIPTVFFFRQLNPTMDYLFSIITLKEKKLIKRPCYFP